MKRIFFLPQWYLESKVNKCRKVMKFVILIMIIVDLIFLDILISRLNKVKLLDYNIKQKVTLENDEYTKRNEEKQESNKTLDSFLIFIKSMPQDIGFENICIENREVNIEISPKSFDYVPFVDKLERENKFIIKSLIPSNEQDNKSFKANLELK